MELSGIKANKAPGHQREQERTQLLFIRNVPARMIISFLETLLLYVRTSNTLSAGALSLSHTQLGSDCGREKGEGERGEGIWFEWCKENRVRERVREVDLSH